MSEAKAHPAFAGAVLATRTPDQPSVSVAERSGIGTINLRGQSDNTGFMEAASNVLGAALPSTPNTVAGSDAVESLWLAPTEWLVRCELHQQAALEQKLTDVLADHFTAINDLSGYYTTLTITGRNAAELLARGTPLDVHPRVFAPGQCAQTVFAHAGIILIPREAQTTRFEMLVRRSFADYVWRWLDNAMRCLD